MKRSAKLIFAFSAIYILGVLSVTAAEINLKVMVYRGGQNLPLFVAQEEGFFKKHGLNVDLITRSPPTNWVQA